METGGLDAMENDGVGGLVVRGMELAVDDHLGEEAVNLSLAELEQQGELLDGDRIVVCGVGEDEGSQGDLLDLAEQHGLDGLGVADVLPAAELEEDVGGGLPVSAGELLGGGDDKVSRALSRPHSPKLALGHADEAGEGAGKRAVLDVVLVGSEVGHLKQQGGDEMDRLDGLQADVLVVGDLAALLQALLLGRPLDSEAELGQALGEEFLVVGAHAGVQVHEARVGVGDQAGAEGGQAELDHGAVEEDLDGDVQAADAVLEVAHQDHIAGLREAIVDGVVVDAHQQCLSLGCGESMFVHNGSEDLDAL